MRARSHIYIQVYADPTPPLRDVLDSINVFVNAVMKSLKMGTNRGCRLSVTFRTDVNRFLFENKGSAYAHGTGRLYTLDDFDIQYFPKG